MRISNVNKQLDILIIGAGISGIGLAVHLLKNCPQRSFEIVEKRNNYGGTWDLFKYPGIRSDSDMTTFGYHFKPWKKSSTLADANSIKTYLGEVLDEYKFQQKINYNHQVVSANFNRKKRQWCVEILDENQEKKIWWVNFILGCTGYYNYDSGYQPKFPNVHQFKGEIVHPQQWTDQLDYQNKKVVIIGSGATAITLVPALVKGGVAHVTMLQRSPSYIASIPAQDSFYEKMRQYVSEARAYKLARMRNITMQRAIYLLAQKQPKLLRRILLKSVRHELAGKVDMKHFTPSYMPWEQRLCVVPDGDLFKVLQGGHASIETDQIDYLTETGIHLKSGKEISADIIISATGLNIQILGGIDVFIDDKKVNFSEHMLYQGILFNDIPNMAILIGYINASWTLKVDISAEYLCRLFNYMNQFGYQEVIAQGDLSQRLQNSVMGSLSSGYISRAVNIMPKQGLKAPWHVSNNYLADRKTLKNAKFDDGILKFRA